MTTLDHHPRPYPGRRQDNPKPVAVGATALLGLIAAGTLLVQRLGYRVPLWFCLLPVLLLLVLLWWGFDRPPSRKRFGPRNAANRRESHLPGGGDGELSEAQRSGETTGPEGN